MSGLSLAWGVRSIMKIIEYLVKNDVRCRAGYHYRKKYSKNLHPPVLNPLPVARGEGLDEDALPS